MNPMSKTSRTAGKTAKKIRRVYALRVTAREYAALQTAARAMNKTTWCGGNTAQSVFREFVARDMFEPWKLRELIFSGIATGEGGMDAPEPLHLARIAELSAEFSREG